MLQNLIAMICGDETKVLRAAAVNRGFLVLGASVTGVQIGAVMLSPVLLTFLYVAMRVTRIGKAARAVANDPELASLAGIETERVVLWVFIVGSVLAGCAGVTFALDIHMNPPSQ